MSKKNRKWLVFTIMCLAYMPGSYAQYQLSVYASELILSFGLTTSQFSSLFTAPMIVAIFLSFVGGMISDKVGSKKVINISFVIAGIGMIGRVFANSYMPFFLCMALTGFSNMFVNINASKITASWFEQEKLGILMGIFAFCGQLPGAFATATTAVLFDSRTSAFIVSAIFCISVFVLWLLFVKDKPEDTRPVSAISPGVLGIKGIETMEILKGVVDNVKPKLLIVIDALASRSIDRISSSIQIADTGIVPGAGVENKRKEISQNTLGIPVIAIGIPTVVDLATVTNECIDIFIESLQEKAMSNDYLNKLKEKDNYEEIKEALVPKDYNMIVTPKEIDKLIENMSKIISRAINMAM